ncbi:MAG TPA: hypothetical protein VKR58_05980 [Aquella sp.]|nr:hypothetical protein [Aquella sp.]
MAGNEQVFVELGIGLNLQEAEKVKKGLRDILSEGMATNAFYRQNAAGQFINQRGQFVSHSEVGTYVGRQMALSAAASTGRIDSYIPGSGRGPNFTNVYGQNTQSADQAYKVAIRNAEKLQKDLDKLQQQTANRVNSSINQQVKDFEKAEKLKTQIAKAESNARIKQEELEAAKKLEIQKKFQALSPLGKLNAWMHGGTPQAIENAGRAGSPPIVPFGRGNNSLFNEFNHRTTNVAQLAGVSLYGLGAVGAGVYGVKQSFDAAAEMKRSELALTGIVNTYYKFLDAQGKSVSNAENLNRAVQHSHELYQKIAQVAPKALMSTQDLADVYTANLGLLASKRGGITSGNKAGYNEDQMLEIISKVAELRGLFGDQAGSLTANLQPFGTGVLNRRSARTLQNIGLSTDTWQSTAKTEGPQGLFNLFEKAIEKFKPVLDSIANSPEGKMKELDAAFVKMKQTIGVELMPVILPFMERLSASVQRWVSSGAAKRFGDDVAGVLAALGKVATGTISILSGFKGNLAEVLGLAGFLGVVGVFVKGMAVKAVEARAGVVGFLGVIGLLVTGLFTYIQQVREGQQGIEKGAIGLSGQLSGVSPMQINAAGMQLNQDFPGGTGFLPQAQLATEYLGVTKAYNQAARQAYNKEQQLFKGVPGAGRESFESWLNRQSGKTRGEEAIGPYVAALRETGKYFIGQEPNDAAVAAEWNTYWSSEHANLNKQQDALSAFEKNNAGFISGLPLTNKAAYLLAMSQRGKNINSAISSANSSVVGTGGVGGASGIIGAAFRGTKPFNVVGNTDLTPPPKVTGGDPGIQYTTPDRSDTIMAIAKAQADVAFSQEYIDAMPTNTPADRIAKASAIMRLQQKQEILARAQYRDKMQGLSGDPVAFKKGLQVSPLPDDPATAFKLLSHNTKNQNEALQAYKDELNRQEISKRAALRGSREELQAGFSEYSRLATAGAAGVADSFALRGTLAAGTGGSATAVYSAKMQELNQREVEARIRLNESRKLQYMGAFISGNGPATQEATNAMNAELAKIAVEKQTVKFAYNREQAQFTTEMAFNAAQRGIGISSLGMSSLNFAGRRSIAEATFNAEIARANGTYSPQERLGNPQTAARYIDAVNSARAAYTKNLFEINASAGQNEVEMFMAAHAEGMGQSGPQGQIALKNYRIALANQRIKGANLSTPEGVKSAESDSLLIQAIEKQIKAIEANTVYLGILSGKSLEAAKSAAYGSAAPGFVGSMADTFNTQAAYYTSLQGDDLTKFAAARGVRTVGRTPEQIRNDLQIQDYGSAHKGFQLGAAADAAVGALMGPKRSLTIGSVIEAVGGSQNSLLNNALRDIQRQGTSVTKNGVTLPGKLINGGNIGDYGQILASVIGGNLGGDSRSGSSIGGAIGSGIGSIIPGLGTVTGGILGTLGGGLIGSLFGRQEDPATAAYRRKIAELLTRIDKSLRPVGDYYRTKVNVYSAASAYVGGRALGAGDRLGAI